MRAFTLLLLGACGGSAPAPTPLGNRDPRPVTGTATAATTAAPDRDALVALLRDFATIEARDVPAGRSAAEGRGGGMDFAATARERGCPADETIDQYVARLVQYGLHGDGPGDVHSLTGGCGDWPAAEARIPLDPPYDPAYWYCLLDARTSDPAGESPWQYDLRLRIHRTSRLVDLASAGCGGTP